MSASLNGTEPSIIALDITACEREPILIPGAIQPDGILLVVDPVSLEIVAGAGEIETRLDPDWLGRSANGMLGQALEPQVLALTTNALSFVVLGQISGIAGTFNATARLSSSWLVIELEPATPNPSSFDRLLALTAASATFERTVDLKLSVMQRL
jgi:light-regulated signal transduction histidine kinase (bacteriophytochrome)